MRGGLRFTFSIWISILLVPFLPLPIELPLILVRKGVPPFYYLLFLAVLGLCFRARALSSCGERGPLFTAVRGPLTVAASPIAAEHRLQTRRLSSCGPRAQPLHGMRDPPRPGHEPVSPALAGGPPTPAPQGKPSTTCLNNASVVTVIIYQQDGSLTA